MTEISNRLRGSSCVAGSSELRVRTAPERLYTYPDVVVICGKAKFVDDQKDTLLNPSMLFEVLSDSTEAKDRGFKFHQYQEIESLKEYVLVSQKEPRIEVFWRTAPGEWQLTEYAGLHAVARFTTIGCQIPLADIYREEVSA